MARTYHRRVVPSATYRRVAFQRRVWALLTTSRDHATDYVRLRIRDAARALGASPWRVWAALQALAELGYIRRVDTAAAAGRPQQLVIVQVVMPFLLAA